MNTYDLIPSLSTAVFVFVAFYYWQSMYKFFFLLIAISDILSILLWEVFSFSSQALWIPLDYLLLFSLDKKTFLERKYSIVIGLIPVLILNYFSTTFIQNIFGLLINLLLLFLFIRYIVAEYLDTNNINLFYVLMILFEINIVIRLIAIINEVKLGLNVFFSGIIIQIIIGIFLIIIRKGVVISLKE